ncbi:hypothetical protein BBJ29_007175 [Phytophthora kernoviae]|uniref:Uncharacterized protein n=1 Tax=Phytophthora kernoviae TaxID=325452 RepID=A0A3R7JA34_9STRA|nr:hypothetical protein BBJ29_007175 [Phytophthora kernoviae]
MALKLAKTAEDSIDRFFERDDALSRLGGLYNDTLGAVEDELKAPRPQEFTHNVLDLAVQKVVEKLSWNLLTEAHATPTSVGVPALLDLCIAGVANQYLVNSTPYKVLEDLMEGQTISTCEKVWVLLESRKGKLTTSDFIAGPGRTTKASLCLLRLCNALLRRLSKTHNSVFCGKILLFLSFTFALSERSAVNLTGKANVTNVTVFEDQDAFDLAESTDAVKTSEIVPGLELDSDPSADVGPIDYNLYRTFWDLQSFFREHQMATQSAENWEKFFAELNVVLAAFEGNAFSPDDLERSRDLMGSSGAPIHSADVVMHEAESESSKNTMEQVAQEHFFQPKYLTNSRLFRLQLRDPILRECMLTQFLILFNDLTRAKPPVGSTTPKAKLAELNDRVVALLKQTPSDGEGFSEMVSYVLERERNWVKWKQEKCPPYEKFPPKEGEGTSSSSNQPVKRPRRQLTSPLLEQILSESSKPSQILEKIKGKERATEVSLNSYTDRFKEAWDPENGIEKEYWPDKDEMEEHSDDDFDFDYEQFLLAAQVQRYYYRGFYPRGIFVIWSLLRADCYDLNGCDNYGIPPIVYASKCGSAILLRLLLYYKADINALSKDCYTTGSALAIARKGTSEDHALVLKALEGKLVAEREALLVEIVATRKKAPAPPPPPPPALSNPRSMLSMAGTNNAFTDGGPRVIRLSPYKYVHVLDTNSNVSRVLAGPLTYTRQEHEHVMTVPQDMIVLPAQHYVEVRNPVVRSEDGKIIRDAFDQAKLKHGEIEFRIFDKYPEPFPLYPGEEQVGNISELRVVPVDTALRIRVSRKIDKYAAGDEWLFVGPATYYPRVEEEIVAVVQAIVIKKNQAIKFRAEKKCTDSQGVKRDAGEEWLVRTPGAYLPQIDEVHVETLQAHILTEQTALNLRALRTFKDIYGISRRAGEEWLITTKTTETHVQDVHEDIIGYVNVTILTNRQYCVVVDPVINGVQRRGTRQLRKGDASFFLQPGEQLENDRVEDICVLADDEAVLLQAVEPFKELPEGGEPEGEDGGDVPIKKSAGVKREAGERWMVHGPREYIPPIQVKVLETRRAIPLDINEGVYVRDRKTGHVRAVKGETYMLQPTEELWAKYLSPAVEELLSSGSAYVTDPTQSNKITASLGRPWSNKKDLRPRDPTRVVTFEVPHNAGLQVYDYKTTSSRILFGPTLVMLEPDEQFTVLRLSGGVPKEPNVIRTLCMQLGPDFMRDQIIVETSDHARLSLTIAYNWRFRVDTSKPAEAAKVFNVKDFTGDACKTLASRIRGAVAVQDFDYFHKNSAQIIRTSIFGLDENNKLRSELIFPANNLSITNVDIQAAEPVDQLTRESLQKSVQLAIEITTKSQEARAKAIAMKEEEAAKGELLRQQLDNQSSAEEARKNLVQLIAECSAVQEEAAAVSRARAQAQAAEIEGQAAVRQAELRAKAVNIEHEAQVTRVKEDQALSVAHAERLVEIEVRKKRELMAIEAEKFQQMVSSVGQDTLVALARAGPDGQVKMLEALGLSGYLITDGKSPVNLLGTAEGIIRGISQAEQ